MPVAIDDQTYGWKYNASIALPELNLFYAKVGMIQADKKRGVWLYIPEFKIINGVNGVGWEATCKPSEFKDLTGLQHLQFAFFLIKRLVLKDGRNDIQETKDFDSAAYICKVLEAANRNDEHPFAYILMAWTWNHLKGENGKNETVEFLLKFLSNKDEIFQKLAEYLSKDIDNINSIQCKSVEEMMVATMTMCREIIHKYRGLTLLDATDPRVRLAKFMLVHSTKNADENKRKGKGHEVNTGAHYQMTANQATEITTLRQYLLGGYEEKDKSELTELIHQASTRGPNPTKKDSIPADLLVLAIARKTMKSISNSTKHSQSTQKLEVLKYLVAAHCLENKMAKSGLKHQQQKGGQDVLLLANHLKSGVAGFKPEKAVIAAGHFVKIYQIYQYLTMRSEKNNKDQKRRRLAFIDVLKLASPDTTGNLTDKMATIGKKYKLTAKSHRGGRLFNPIRSQIFYNLCMEFVHSMNIHGKDSAQPAMNAMFTFLISQKSNDNSLAIKIIAELGINALTETLPTELQKGLSANMDDDTDDDALASQSL